MRVLQRVMIAAVVGGAVIAAPVTAAGQDDELTAAKERVAEARAAATAAAGRVTDAIGRVQALGDEIRTVEDRIAAGAALADELRVLVQRRAHSAYTGSSSNGLEVLEAREPSEAARKTEYLERVNARDNAAVDELRAVNEDLAVQRTELDEARAEQVRVLEELERERERLDGLLAEAEAARAALEERLARESAARQAAEAAALARQQAAPAGASGPGSGSGSGHVIGGLVCPVPGAAFTDSWGAPRSGGRTHQGTDLMAPYGAPNHAVVDGSVSVSSSGNGGSTITLAGDDGNDYLYMHLQSYEVTSGSVSQGDVIAYTGDTGNATGVPHTHFELHEDGAGPINPYPSLARVC